MIYACLPVGSDYGWGILGKYVVLELAGLAATRLVLIPNQQQTVNDELDLMRLRPLIAGREEMEGLARGGVAGAKVIQSTGPGFAPLVPQFAGPSDVCFAVFEENVLSPAAVENVRRHYRYVATGSTYCAEVLRAHGVMNVMPVLHGVDTQVFHPAVEGIFKREMDAEKFVVFSGGKFELRKGQDLVIRAYKVLQDRHKDVMLVNAWFNKWPASRDTMASSKLIRYAPPTGNDHVGWVTGILAGNGVDVSRVITLGIRDNRLMPRIYWNTDVGIFPNRVEGGTNMVMMEYMACGKTVVGAFNSGHKDILREENAVLIRGDRALRIEGPDGKLISEWRDPDLEETVEHLEWCYQNREKVLELGAQAGRDLAGFTWTRVAQGLLDAAGKASV